jgi:hypothetical protein
MVVSLNEVAQNEYLLNKNTLITKNQTIVFNQQLNQNSPHITKVISKHV